MKKRITVNIDVDDKTTVLTLKQKIQRETGLNPLEQRIVLGPNELTNEIFLKDLELMKTTAVFLVKLNI